MHLLPPRPHVGHAVLAEAEHDIAIHLGRIAHHLIGMAGLLLALALGHRAVRTPVVLQEIEAPLRVGLRVIASCW